MQYLDYKYSYLGSVHILFWFVRDMTNISYFPYNIKKNYGIILMCQIRNDMTRNKECWTNEQQFSLIQDWTESCKNSTFRHILGSYFKWTFIKNIETVPHSLTSILLLPFYHLTICLRCASVIIFLFTFSQRDVSFFINRTRVSAFIQLLSTFQ